MTIKCIKCKYYLKWHTKFHKTVEECEQSNKELEKECTKCMKNEGEI